MSDMDCLKNTNSATFMNINVADVQTANAVAVGISFIATERKYTVAGPNKIYPINGTRIGKPPCHL